MAYKNKDKQREAQKLWARKNRSSSKAKQRARLQKMVSDHLKEHPCIGCEESDPVVLEFDHIDPSTKVASIANMVSKTYGVEAVRKEIAKCQVLCANCHRRKTAGQLGYYKKKRGSLV